MLTIRKKFSFVSVAEHWYECRYKWYQLFGLHAYMHVKNNVAKPALMLQSESYTVENDLTLSGEEILAGFSKQYRNQVRQAEKEGVTAIYNRDIKTFVPFFNEFAKTKNISLTSERRLEEMGETLMLSHAVLNGQVLVSHSYFYDQETLVVHTYHSASVRFSDTIDKNLVGKANKYLHYQDMLYFQSKGVKTYDFGGYAGPKDTRDLQGVNDFKLGFGGKVVPCVNYMTIPYFILKTLADKLGLLGKG